MRKKDAKGKIHELDPHDVDERDEIDEYQQLCLVWCETCRKYEWHWIDLPEGDA